MTEATVELLRAARQAEKEQALFYRALAVIAEEERALDDIEALNGLLADEQHHLSRITVRLVELGHDVEELHATATVCALNEWQTTARHREQREIERYETLLGQELDVDTRGVLVAILAVEREHEEHLFGKYTDA